MKIRTLKKKKNISERANKQRKGAALRALKNSGLESQEKGAMQLRKGLCVRLLPVSSQPPLPTAQKVILPSASQQK